MYRVADHEYRLGKYSVDMMPIRYSARPCCPAFRLPACCR
jgi:hypothetical protein